MRKINLQTKIMAYLNKDNHGHSYLNPVQANYIRTHVPDAGDIACIITADVCEADGRTMIGKAGAINTLLEVVSLLRKNSYFTGLRDIDLYVYAWYILTDMSMSGYMYVRNEHINYAAKFPLTGTYL